MRRAAVLLILMSCAACAGPSLAGMPSVLPTGWTKEKGRPPSLGSPAPAPGMEARLQAISFFVACVLFSAWCVRGLWRVVRKDFPNLPIVSYGRALALVVLWGLLFVIVLAMISGARELMTPGAWRKQGWTYQLEGASKTANAVDPREERRKALEQLRWSLWKHAAAHEGRFPKRDASDVPPERWTLPGGLGLSFLYVDSRTVDTAGRLLAYEPDVDGPERLVLLTNGTIGTMDTAAIRAALAEGNSP